jgi:hypothetical protein
MPFVKVIAVDPKPPKKGKERKPLCYQVPGNSRELKLLTKMLLKARIDYRVFGDGPRPRWIRRA